MQIYKYKLVYIIRRCFCKALEFDVLLIISLCLEKFLRKGFLSGKYAIEIILSMSITCTVGMGIFIIYLLFNKIILYNGYVEFRSLLKSEVIKYPEIFSIKQDKNSLIIISDKKVIIKVYSDLKNYIVFINNLDEKCKKYNEKYSCRLQKYHM